MPSCIQVNHDVSRSWLDANPVLAQAEFGLETDTRKLKVGDGVTAWDRLAYSIDITYGLADAQKLAGIDAGAQRNPPRVSARECAEERCNDARTFSPADVIEIARQAVERSTYVDGGDALGVFGTVIDGGTALA